MRQDDTYKTKDIFEASWLHSQNLNFIGLEPDEKYFWFVFRDKTLTETFSQLYWSEKADGNVKKFVNSFKTLKDLVFSRKSERGGGFGG